MSMICKLKWLRVRERQYRQYDGDVTLHHPRRQRAALTGQALLLLVRLRLWRRRWLTWGDALQHTVKRLWRFVGAELSRHFLDLFGPFRSGHLAFHGAQSNAGF